MDQIFTVYDEKAHAHLPPFYFQHSDQAMRTFADTINGGDHQFSKHPQDYTLFHHGSFDNHNGAFTLMANPKPLGNGTAFVLISDQMQPGQPNDQISNEAPIRLNTASGNTT